MVECQSPFPVWFQEHDQISSRCNIVDFLLEEIPRRYGYDMLVWFVNITDILNWSVLRYIAEEGCVDILRWLLGKCSLHMNVNSVDFHGFTPLHLAIQNGHTGVVELLLQLHSIDGNVGKCIPPRPANDHTGNQSHRGSPWWSALMHAWAKHQCQCQPRHPRLGHWSQCQRYWQAQAIWAASFWYLQAKFAFKKTYGVI